MSLINTPKGLRLQIALMGRVNAGKSSFLNLVTGQNAAITSPVAGTTTDFVEKAQELLPIGPVLWIDTAGYGDTDTLGDVRMQKTATVFNRADVIMLVTDGLIFGQPEQAIIDEAEKRRIPLLRIINKADTIDQKPNLQHTIYVNSLDEDSRNSVLNLIKKELIEICSDEVLNPPPLLGDLAPKGSTVVMIVPIDYEAPKGRIILPQVQAIRDCLDHDQCVTVVKENAYTAVLENMKTPPALVVCDSQVVRQMVEQTPPDIKCTTFSVLMARFKGDLERLTQGAAALWHLKDNDRVLIAESCTHHAVDDDIGTVKIPRLLAQKTGKTLQIDHVSGCTFPPDLKDYALVIQCGGCMQNRREILSRIQKCAVESVPITNYGICLSALNGVLERVLSPFPEMMIKYGKERK
jgi:[FeFe] hydrogenase H-cluster maturation GTPase HydF